jgi:hypothetical protein
MSAGDAAGRFSESDGSFAPRARHIGLAQRKIRWRSPTAIRLSRDMDADDVVQVQRERLQSLPAVRQLPWPCEPGALNGSLLCPVASIFPARQKNGPTVLGILEPAFCQNFDNISPATIMNSRCGIGATRRGRGGEAGRKAESASRPVIVRPYLYHLDNTPFVVDGFRRLDRFASWLQNLWLELWRAMT